MKTRTAFACTACGHRSPKWLGKCPSCGAWNSMEETVEAAAPKGRGARVSASATRHQPVARPLNAVDAGELARYRTGIEEFDRVLGGGLVPGSLVLIAGDPGVGKSTLLLQAAAAYARKGLRVLYVSAEESDHQIRRRSMRLEALEDSVSILCSTRLELVAPLVENAEADVLIVDSVQTLHHGDSESAPGSVSQVRDSTLFFLELAKRTQVPVLLVGHVTKEGQVAGPRTVEHMVDAVLYLEGDHYHQYRVLRAAKNRFGPTYEVGVFEMGEHGLRAVDNPSELMLAERRPGSSGSAVVVAMEGTRPLLIEVQALVAGSGLQNPRRVSTGFDGRRLAVILAVLEKRAGLNFAASDVFVNVAGGFRVAEPATDLGLALAIASSYYDRALDERLVLLGEVGLGGEVRQVGQLRRRVQEAAKLGFTRVMVPKRGAEAAAETGTEALPISRVDEALRVALGEDVLGPREARRGAGGRAGAASPRAGERVAGGNRS